VLLQLIYISIFILQVSWRWDSSFSSSSILHFRLTKISSQLFHHLITNFILLYTAASGKVHTSPSPKTLSSMNVLSHHLVVGLAEWALYTGVKLLDQQADNPGMLVLENILQKDGEAICMRTY
jgi:hypothetical protein